MSSGTGNQTIRRAKTEHHDEEAKKVYVTVEIRDVDNNLISQQDEIYKKNSNNLLITKKTYDPNGLNLVNEYTYNNKDLETEVKYYSGKWKFTEYNSLNYITKIISPYKNSPFSGDSAQGEVVTRAYTSHDSDDVVSESDGRPRTVTKLLNNVAVAKTFYVYKKMLKSRLKSLK